MRGVVARPLLALLASVLGCEGQSKVCTLIGCSDQATIHVRRASGQTPPRKVGLDVDGRRVTCMAPTTTAPVIGSCDDPSVSVALRDLVICSEHRSGDSRVLTCTPTGNTEQVITFMGTPMRVSVTLTADGTDVVAGAAFAFTYETVYPNGKDCDPGCRQATETWQLP